MTSWHALPMALKAEQRAFDFFKTVVENTQDDELKRWAEEFQQEEAEHVRLVEDLLTQYPKPAADWSHDDDPPIVHD